MDSLRKKVVNIFKMNGLTLKSEAAKYLCSLLSPVDESEHLQWIERTIEAIQKSSIKSPVIDTEVIRTAAQAVCVEEDNTVENLFEVLSIFKVPRLIYDNEKKKFIPTDISQKLSLHGDAADKAAIFRNRYTIVYQRTVNHELFRPPAVGASKGNEKYKLTKIEYLLGVGTQKQDVIVLGMLTQFMLGSHHLEDDTGAIKIDISEAKFHVGLFTYNCIVLVEGTFSDGVLHVKAMGHPPAEAANTSRALMGNLNYFGGKDSVCRKNMTRLQDAENTHTDAMIVILSDVWLDQIKVMEKLHILFDGYSSFPPLAFVICGDFLSCSHGTKQVNELRKAFSSLCNLISEFPKLVANSRFLFVPGPADIGPGTPLPRPALPKFLTEDFVNRIPSAKFVSNPCRFVFCTHEIVVLRENVFTKMCRNSVYFPTDADNIYEHFGRTLISQCHLTPLPLHICPTYWPLDHCLSLHPNPDLVVVADKALGFNTSYNGTCVTNPGSFAKNEFSFKVYIPSKREVEDSQITEQV